MKTELNEFLILSLLSGYTENLVHRKGEKIRDRYSNSESIRICNAKSMVWQAS